MMPRQLVALKAGFYGGELIAAGQTFTFNGEKNPRWAGERPEPVKPALRPDTKPEAAAKAAKAKAAGGADQAA